MSDPIWVDSQYKFTDPVRYFKANDPYYWEVDNIPLKQIQENALWLKDQVAPKQDRRGQLTSVDRKDFNELKPFVTGGNHKVKVKPGRFTARINDVGAGGNKEDSNWAHAAAANRDDSSNELASVMYTEEFPLKFWLDQYEWGNATEALHGSAGKDPYGIAKFKQYLVGNVLNMNGLVERAFTFTTMTEDWLHRDTKTTEASYKGFDYFGHPSVEPFPIADALLWAVNDSAFGYELREARTLDGNGGFHDLPRLENHWIKFWRGVFRTAVVDVPNEIEIAIPPFDPNDHFYFASGVDKTHNNANPEKDKTIVDAVTQRIDLLFVYSKSIDSSEADIAKYKNKTKTTITTPMLGIVKGAGIGIDFRSLGVKGNDRSAQQMNYPAIDSDGNSLILANPSDELDANNGFKNTKVSIHGSFPSPDDLMNISPLIHKDLNETHYATIGQTVLPLAYIVVKKGDETLEDKDIIDIRPFFRTTELAYNERAGIAAAFPQLSFANPAVGQAQVQYEILKVKDDHDAVMKDHVTGMHKAEANSPRIVATGRVWGGLKWGPEASIENYWYHKRGKSKDYAGAREAAHKEIGVPNGTIPQNPSWDKSRWGSGNNVRGLGKYPNDYIQTILRYGRPARYTMWGTAYANPTAAQGPHRTGQFGTDFLVGGRYVNCHFVKKVIQIGNVPDWVKDFQVNCKFEHCQPLTNRVSSMQNDQAAGSAGISVSKDMTGGRDGGWHFTIYAHWTGADIFPNAYKAGSEGGSGHFTARYQNRNSASRTPYYYRAHSEHFAGFVVQTNNIFWESGGHNGRHGEEGFPGEGACGVALYPTVTYEVIGLPDKTEWAGHRQNLKHGTNWIDLV